MKDPDSVRLIVYDFWNAEFEIDDRLSIDLPPENASPAELAEIARDVMWRAKSCAEFFQSFADELSEELGEKNAE